MFDDAREMNLPETNKTNVLTKKDEVNNYFLAFKQGKWKAGDWVAGHWKLSHYGLWFYVVLPEAWETLTLHPGWKLEVSF